MSKFQEVFDKSLKDVSDDKFISHVQNIQQSRGSMHREWEEAFNKYLQTPLNVDNIKLKKIQENYAETVKSITMKFKTFSDVILEIIEELGSRNCSPSVISALKELQEAERGALEATVNWQVTAGAECDIKREEIKLQNGNPNQLSGPIKYGVEQYRLVKQCMQNVAECEREVREEFLEM